MMPTNKKNKKLVGTILASALVVASLGSVSAFAANNADAVRKNTVITAPPAADSVSPDAPNVVQVQVQEKGTIQYRKDVYARTDGSQNITSESWYNPATKEFRSDMREYSADQQLLSYRSNYRVIGGDEQVTIQRDSNGNPTSRTVLTREDDPRLFEIYDQKDVSFNVAKEMYADNSWTLVGTEETSDGKVVNKIMRSYQSYINDTTQANMQLFEFIDPETGLPVKEELYEDSTGQAKLFSSDTNVNEYIKDDGTIFNSDGNLAAAAQ